MSEKRPISEVLRDVYSAHPGAREMAGREMAERSDELLAIVEEATQHAHVGPGLRCQLCKALIDAGEEPKP